jgi:hypothetical protein
MMKLLLVMLIPFSQVAAATPPTLNGLSIQLQSEALEERLGQLAGDEAAIAKKFIILREQISRLERTRENGGAVEPQLDELLSEAIANDADQKAVAAEKAKILLTTELFDLMVRSPESETIIRLHDERARLYCQQIAAQLEAATARAEFSERNLARLSEMAGGQYIPLADFLNAQVHSARQRETAGFDGYMGLGSR